MAGTTGSFGRLCGGDVRQIDVEGRCNPSGEVDEIGSWSRDRRQQVVSEVYDRRQRRRIREAAVAVGLGARCGDAELADDPATLPEQRSDEVLTGVSSAGCSDR